MTIRLRDDDKKRKLKQHKFIIPNLKDGGAKTKDT